MNTHTATPHHFAKRLLFFLEDCDSRKVLNLGDLDLEFNSETGFGYGQKTGCVISITLLHPHATAGPDSLKLPKGHQDLFSVTFDGVLIGRFNKRRKAIASIKRILETE